MNRKKTFSLLLILLLLVSLLTACGGDDADGESTDADPYKGLTLYETDCGVSLYMKEGFEEDTVEGFAYYFMADDCGLSAKEETFESMEAVGYSSDISIADYAKLILDAYQLNGEVQTDDYGNTYIIYTQVIQGVDISYFAFFDKGTTSFWASTFVCPSEDAEDFDADFRLWASSIQVP